MHGICPTATNYVVNAVNCYSSGLLNITNGSEKSGSAILVAGNSSTRTNCYYLDGVAGTTGIAPRTGETIFYKTSEDENAMTTAKVVQTFNDYIESNPEGVSTVGWCKWVIGENNLPALDFNTEWNGTTWVTTNN